MNNADDLLIRKIVREELKKAIKEITDIIYAAIKGTNTIDEMKSLLKDKIRKIIKEEISA